MESRTVSRAASVADVAEDLMVEFDGRVDLATVSTVVLTARRELHGQVPINAMPELLHRLAHERLTHLAAGG